MRGTVVVTGASGESAAEWHSDSPKAVPRW